MNLARARGPYREFLNQHRRPAEAPDLVLAGAPGWIYDDVFESIDRLGIGDRVRHISRPSEADLVALMNGALALIMPSRYEGFGLSSIGSDVLRHAGLCLECVGVARAGRRCRLAGRSG